jgi:Phage tail tube protein
MPFGSGLSASVGIASESTVGTQVTPNAWYEFLSESLSNQPTYIDSQGLKAGLAYKRVARTQISRQTVGGDISLEFFDKGTTAAGGKGMGLWLRHMLGSTVAPVQIAATTAYKQNHVPGPKTGLSFTTQIGRPQTDGTIKAHTYRGCKILSWEFSISDGELAQLSMTLDGWREDTATGLTTPVFGGSTYQAGIFSFADASTFTLGGTASTTGGETTVAGGVSVATVVRGFTLRGETPLATERYGLGNAGTKREQIDNGIQVITGTLEAEYTSQAEIYALFAANTTTVLDLAFTHGDAGTSNPYQLRFTLPAIKLKEAAVNVGGPDIISQSINFEAYDDGSNSNPPIQIKLVSQDQLI